MGKIWEKRRVSDYASAYELWCVVNPYGQFWSAKTYKTEMAAMDAVSVFWNHDHKQIAKFKAIPVTVVISDARIEVINAKEGQD